MINCDNGCTVLYTNADGLLNKKSELEAVVNEVKPGIIAITEIKAKRQTNIELAEYSIPGYTLFINQNPHLGVALYTKESLNALECTDLNNSDFQEAVWCSITTENNDKILFGCIYKSPSSSDDNVRNLQMLLRSDIIKQYSKVCIVGDFNCPNIDWNGKWTSTKDEEFVECLRDAYLHQMVKNPTRRRDGQRPTLDDLVLVNDEQLLSDITHYCPLGKSDHDVLIFNLYVKEKKESREEENRFDLGRGNYNALRKDFESRDWKDLNNLDVESCWNLIKVSIKEGMDKHIPMINKKEGYGKPKWITNEAKKSIKKKQELYKKYLKTQKQYDYKKYLEYRNECNRVIKQAKREYERKLAGECKNNPKHFWKFVSSKTKSFTGISPLNNGEGGIAETDEDKANTLNAFFSSVFTKENTDNVPQLDDCSRSGGIGIAEILVTPEAVKKKLQELNPGKAQGPDKIPPRVLKELAEVLAGPLSVLFNKSLETGVIPLEWKTAEVVAIFKKGTRSEPGNYRPVSLTCVLCKMLESFVRDAIVNHMTVYNLYSECQHGFRKSRSCVTQLLEVMEILTDFIDDGESVDIIYLDFKKAFDAVPHQRLLSKLSFYGITGNVHKWVEDFLKGRTQRVRVGRDFSSSADVLSGIPQGSILGPILFTIFINDISDNIKSCCRIFADDTKVFNISSESEVLQNDLETLQEWTATWDLHFNVSKCNVMHMGRGNENCSYILDVNNGVTEINKCTEEKDLGVIFDQKLSFDAHIQSIIKKANRNLGIIRRAFSFLDKSTFLLLYKALVRPILEYANVIWHPRLKRQSVSIERVQRRATKILPELRECTYEERMRILNLPSLKYRRYRGDLIQTFKILNKVDDLRVEDFFTLNNNTITRDSDIKLGIKYCSTNTKKFCFSNRCAKYWNSLSPLTRRAENLNQFKNLLDKDCRREIFSFDFDK